MPFNISQHADEASIRLVTTAAAAFGMGVIIGLGAATHAITKYRHKLERIADILESTATRLT